MKLKHYIMLLLFGVIAFFYFTISPNEVDFLLKCPLYISTGFYCPGCGSQRAIHNILHLNFKEALSNNVFLVIGLIGLLYHYSIPVVNTLFKKDLRSFFSKPKIKLSLLILAILFWVLRNIPMYPFTLLAPNG